MVSSRDVGIELSVEETGSTFEENARIKARAYFDATIPAERGMTIGEDSGIAIDALGGEPGVYSARYHGLPDGPTKNAHILELLRDVPQSRRGCRYVCAIVLIQNDGTEEVFEARCAGRIALGPAGEGGFGYDPIMWIPRLGCTMAQLTETEKNAISHRGRAARRLAHHLSRIMSSRRGVAQSG